MAWTARYAVTVPFSRGTGLAEGPLSMHPSCRPLDADGDSAARYPYLTFHALNFGCSVAGNSNGSMAISVDLTSASPRRPGTGRVQGQRLLERQLGRLDIFEFELGGAEVIEKFRIVAIHGGV